MSNPYEIYLNKRVKIVWRSYDSNTQKPYYKHMKGMCIAVGEDFVQIRAEHDNTPQTIERDAIVEMKAQVK